MARIKTLLFSVTVSVLILGPLVVLAEEAQFLTTLDVEINSQEDCLSVILAHEDSIISAVADARGEVSGSNFYQESIEISGSEDYICLVSFKLVSEESWIEDGKVMAKKEWDCSAASEEPEFDSAGNPSCKSVLREVKKEADQVKIGISSGRDVFLEEFSSGPVQKISHLETFSESVPWWYYISILVVLIILFPAITFAYGNYTRRNKK